LGARRKRAERDRRRFPTSITHPVGEIKSKRIALSADKFFTSVTTARMKFLCERQFYISADVSITQNYLISAGSDSGSLGCFYFDDSSPLVPRAEKLFPHLCEFVTELLSRRKNSGERSVTKAGGCVRATLLCLFQHAKVLS
jgi:hypothetical protein